jgi:hypothetical protein
MSKLSTNGDNASLSRISIFRILACDCQFILRFSPEEVGSTPKLSREIMGPVEAAAVVFITLEPDAVAARRGLARIMHEPPAVTVDNAG